MVNILLDFPTSHPHTTHPFSNICAPYLFWPARTLSAIFLALLFCSSSPLDDQISLRYSWHIYICWIHWATSKIHTQPATHSRHHTSQTKRSRSWFDSTRAVCAISFFRTTLHMMAMVSFLQETLQFVWKVLKKRYRFVNTDSFHACGKFWPGFSEVKICSQLNFFFLCKLMPFFFLAAAGGLVALMCFAA